LLSVYISRCTYARRSKFITAVPPSSVPTRLRLLVTTFYGGPTGWHTRQQPDGTIAWTTPTGHTYTTVPGSRILFPDKHFPASPPAARVDTPSSDHPGRDLMMPTRRRARTDDRTRRTRCERALNWADLLESESTPEAKLQLAERLIVGDSSPPF